MEGKMNKVRSNLCQLLNDTHTACSTSLLQYEYRLIYNGRENNIALLMCKNVKCSRYGPNWPRGWIEL
jgi:hypothetical protein